MKWLFSTFIPFVALYGCQTPRDETAEFIRLEKELAAVADIRDQKDYKNYYTQYGQGERMAEQTDSLLAIAADYDRLILQTRKTDYSMALRQIAQQVERRKSNYRQRIWEARKTDSMLVINRALDIEFKKYALRVKLSRVFENLHTVTCGPHGTFFMMDLHHFLTYRRHGDTLEGEFGMGYVVGDDLTARLQLTHKGKTIAPITHSADYIKTEATYLPTDTGTHTLTGYITLHDPITGREHSIQEQRHIYVKP